MPFIAVRKGAHHQDLAYLLRTGHNLFWTSRVEEATRFNSEEEVAALVQASPAGPAFERGVTFEIATAPAITTNFGPFIVVALIAATCRELHYDFDGVTASWRPPSHGRALRFATRAAAEIVAARFSEGDSPATAALTAAGLPLANPVQFEVIDLGAVFGRRVE